MKVLKNVKLYGELTDISVENGKIAAIGKTDIDGTDFGGNEIYPGLIDTHSHGCIGLDASDKDVDLARMADYELENGVSTWYPTTATADAEILKSVTSMNLDVGHGANMSGFHMEGPFININYKGGQNAEFVQSISADFFN